MADHMVVTVISPVLNRASLVLELLLNPIVLILQLFELVLLGNLVLLLGL